MEKHIHKQSQIGSHLISIAQLCDFYEEVTRFLIEVKFVLFEYVSWLTSCVGVFDDPDSCVFE